jgi:hypothetical protein
MVLATSSHGATWATTPNTMPALHFARVDPTASKEERKASLNQNRAHVMRIVRRSKRLPATSQTSSTESKKSSPTRENTDRQRSKSRDSCSSALSSPYPHSLLGAGTNDPFDVLAVPKKSSEVDKLIYHCKYASSTMTR